MCIQCTCIYIIHVYVHLYMYVLRILVHFIDCVAQSGLRAILWIGGHSIECAGFLDCAMQSSTFLECVEHTFTVTLLQHSERTRFTSQSNFVSSELHKIYYYQMNV